jgi:hypothetical protein
MALNMYSFFLPLNIVKYQPSFIEIMLTREPDTRKPGSKRKPRPNDQRPKKERR